MIILVWFILLILWYWFSTWVEEKVGRVYARWMTFILGPVGICAAALLRMLEDRDDRVRDRDGSGDLMKPLNS